MERRDLLRAALCAPVGAILPEIPIVKQGETHTINMGSSYLMITAIEAARSFLKGKSCFFRAHASQLHAQRTLQLCILNPAYSQKLNDELWDFCKFDKITRDDTMPKDEAEIYDELGNLVLIKALAIPVYF